MHAIWGWHGGWRGKRRCPGYSLVGDGFPLSILQRQEFERKLGVTCEAASGASLACLYCAEEGWPPQPRRSRDLDAQRQWGSRDRSVTTVNAVACGRLGLGRDDARHVRAAGRCRRYGGVRRALYPSERQTNDALRWARVFGAPPGKVGPVPGVGIGKSVHYVVKIVRAAVGAGFNSDSPLTITADS